MMTETPIWQCDDHAMGWKKWHYKNKQSMCCSRDFSVSLANNTSGVQSSLLPTEMHSSPDGNTALCNNREKEVQNSGSSWNSRCCFPRVTMCCHICSCRPLMGVVGNKAGWWRGHRCSHVSQWHEWKISPLRLAQIKSQKTWCIKITEITTWPDGSAFGLISRTTAKAKFTWIVQRVQSCRW